METFVKHALVKAPNGTDKIHTVSMETFGKQALVKSATGTDKIRTDIRHSTVIYSQYGNLWQTCLSQSSNWNRQNMYGHTTQHYNKACLPNVSILTVVIVSTETFGKHALVKAATGTDKIRMAAMLMSCTALERYVCHQGLRSCTLNTSTRNYVNFVLRCYVA